MREHAKRQEHEQVVAGFAAIAPMALTACGSAVDASSPGLVHDGMPGAAIQGEHAQSSAEERPNTF